MARLSERLPKPSGFATRIGFNGLAQIAPIVAGLVITPLLIDRLGADRFGIWSFALIALNVLASLDGGIRIPRTASCDPCGARRSRGRRASGCSARWFSFSFSDSCCR
jgi:hypothetical protein